MLIKKTKTKRIVNGVARLRAILDVSPSSRK